ncbi:glycerophosphodiester phosphodiesterase [Actinocorallia longicatena]|uniref:Glycerophosphoryl diester phosphodiesterase n=1 Tax=Actinocorallia longicatena TaxID=111803 RepID=A0ABP6QH98_9ACTN
MALVSAHRRDSDDEPTALARALSTGAEYVELDIRRGPAGDLLVSHDRLTGIPRTGVLDALKLLQGRAKAHLDLKEEGHELTVVEMTEEIMGPGNYVVTTKSPRSIRTIKDARPEVHCALSVGRSFWERGFVSDIGPVNRIRACGADWVALNYRLAGLGVLDRCAKAGFPAMLWTINDLPTIRRYIHDPRVAVLITDRPAEALALRLSTRG